MRIEELISSLAEAQGFAGPANDPAVRAFAEACDRTDTDMLEGRRIQAINDQIDTEDLIYTRAVAALDRSDRRAAVSALRRCATAGIGESSWLLGSLLHESGKATEAIQWYQHAANDGDTRAEARLAELHPVSSLVLQSGPAGRLSARRRRGRHQGTRLSTRRGSALAGGLIAAALFAVLSTGSLSTAFQGSAHPLPTPSSASPGAAPRVETTSASMEPTGPAVTHHATPGRSQLASICRAYYSSYKAPESSTGSATRLSLWEQLTKLAGTGDQHQVSLYCAPYVRDLVAGVTSGNASTPPNDPAPSSSSLGNGSQN